MAPKCRVAPVDLTLAQLQEMGSRYLPGLLGIEVYEVSEGAARARLELGEQPGIACLKRQRLDSVPVQAEPGPVNMFDANDVGPLTLCGRDNRLHLARGSYRGAGPRQRVRGAIP